MVDVLRKSYKLWKILGVPKWRNAYLRFRVAASTEHVRVLRLLPACRTVVDVGANRGQFALAARHVFPDAAIFSFEPLKGPVASFEAVFSADAGVRIFNTAVGIGSGSVAIHVSQRDDSSSLLPISEEQVRVFPSTAEVATESVRVEQLSKLIDVTRLSGPTLLKIDVQGYELEVLKGAADSMAYFDYLYVECSFLELYEGQALADEVIAWLRGEGMRLYGCYNMSYDTRGQAVQADFLFSKSPSAG